MTFKANWEKTQSQHDISDELIHQMIAMIYPDNPITHADILAGGCVNINVKIDLEHSTTPLILRIYLRDPKAAYKEQHLAQRLQGKVPIPNIHHIAELSEYTFSIAEYLPGITLSDLLLGNEPHDLEAIMYQAGKSLSQIASITFDQPGFFDSNLTMNQTNPSPDLRSFCLDALNVTNVQHALSAHKRQHIEDMINTHAHFFPDTQEANLVHADFDPANILVNNINGEITLSGILDWEFSFAGSTLWDVANMLRYAHHMPKSYQDSFLEGLTSGGYALPDHWETSIKLLNLVSLLDCLQRYDPRTRPIRLADIQTLVGQITSSIDP